MLEPTDSLWSFLDPEQKDLITDADHLLLLTDSDKRILTDYSFLVFPVAKVYEGFLKKIFYKNGLINEDQFKGQRFRVGKALNPMLDKLFPQDSIYSRLDALSHDKTLAPELWNAWREGRNLLFHYFPDQLRCISRNEAEEKINLILKAMERSMVCLAISNNEKALT